MTDIVADKGTDKVWHLLGILVVHFVGYFVENG